MTPDTTQAVCNQNKTGGGPEEKTAIYVELVFSIIGEQSEGVDGIDGRSHRRLHSLVDVFVV